MANNEKVRPYIYTVLKYFPPELHTIFNDIYFISTITITVFVDSVSNSILLPSIPVRIFNHTPSKVWGEITYPFSNFNGATVEFGNG